MENRGPDSYLISSTAWKATKIHKEKALRRNGDLALSLSWSVLQLAMGSIQGMALVASTCAGSDGVGQRGVDLACAGELEAELFILPHWLVKPSVASSSWNLKSACAQHWDPRDVWFRREVSCRL